MDWADKDSWSRCCMVGEGSVPAPYEMGQCAFSFWEFIDSKSQQSP